MAGRTAGYKHLQSTRDKIQAAQLINRLEKHCFADEPLMDASQVNAAKALLNKVLPDLKAIEHKGDEDSPIRHVLETVLVDDRSKIDS